MNMMERLVSLMILGAITAITGQEVFIKFFQGQSVTAIIGGGLMAGITGIGVGMVGAGLIMLSRIEYLKSRAGRGSK